MTEKHQTVKDLFIEDVFSDLENKKYEEAIKRFNHACFWGYYNEVKSAIESGTNINAPDESGRTPLMNACVSDSNYDTVQLLIQNGADVNAKTFFGSTALSFAKRNKCPKVIELLLQSGAKDNVEEGTKMNESIEKFKSIFVEAIMEDFTIEGQDKGEESIYDEELDALEDLITKFEMEESTLNEQNKNISKKWEKERQKELDIFHKKELKWNKEREKERDRIRKQMGLKTYSQLNREERLNHFKNNIKGLKNRVYDVLTSLSQNIKDTAKEAALASLIPLSIISGALVGDFVGTSYNPNSQSMTHAVYQEIKKAFDSKSDEELEAAAKNVSDKAARNEIKKGEILVDFLKEIGIKKN